MLQSCTIRYGKISFLLCFIDPVGSATFDQLDVLMCKGGGITPLFGHNAHGFLFNCLEFEVIKVQSCDVAALFVPRSGAKILVSGQNVLKRNLLFCGEFGKQRKK